MNIQSIQNNNYQTNFGMAAKIPSWQKTAHEVGIRLADALDDAQPIIEQLAKEQDVKIITQKARNLYERGFKIIVSPIERNIYGRDFLDRFFKPAPYVSKTIRNQDIQNGQSMKNLLISSVKELIADLKEFGYDDIKSVI